MASFLCPPPYIFTLHGILNIIEMVLSILTFAISFGGGWWWNAHGGGWVEFVGITALILIFIFFFLHIVNLYPAIMTRWHVELIVYIALSIMFMIAGIVAAAYYYSNDSVKACSFFAFATMLTLFIDIGFRVFRGMQSRNEHPSSVPQTQPPVNQVPSEYTSSNAVY